VTRFPAQKCWSAKQRMTMLLLAMSQRLLHFRLHSSTLELRLIMIVTGCSIEFFNLTSTFLIGISLLDRQTLGKISIGHAETLLTFLHGRIDSGLQNGARVAALLLLASWAKSLPAASLQEDESASGMLPSIARAFQRKARSLLRCSFWWVLCWKD
jgi:hypothetical protein